MAGNSRQKRTFERAVERMFEKRAAVVQPKVDKSARVYFWIGLSVALIPYGLSLIGVSLNVYLGGLILLAAFGCVFRAFWAWEYALRLHKAWRIATIVIVGLLYFGMSGRQMIREYKTEHAKIMSPSPPAIARPTSPAQNAETLLEMFNNDFPGTSNWSIPWGYAEEDGSKLTITINLYSDRNANAKFVALYVPRSKYSYVTSLAFSRDIYTAIGSIEQRFNVTQHTPGQAGVVSENDLVFSKRIFLYAEDDFSAEQMGNLTGHYKDKGFDLQIRSNDYAMLHNLQPSP